MRTRAGELEPRVWKLRPPCENPKQGCAKGHWSAPIEITAAQRRVLDLFEAATATGGAVLSEAERRDEILLFVFARLAEYRQARERAYLRANLEVIRAAVRQ